MDMFEEVVGLARQKLGRDGVAHERDTAPPGSILNANISGFWLTMDLLDVDNTTPAVRRVRACFACARCLGFYRDFAGQEELVWAHGWRSVFWARDHSLGGR
jgi:hypothetical protein